MPPKFEEWKAQTDYLPEVVAKFEKWLFLGIASMLFADKAGELLMLRGEDSRLSIDQCIQRIAELSGSWGFSYSVVYPGHGCATVIIYDSARVQQTLSNVPRQVFDKLGYRHDIGPSEFLEEVRRRWQDKEQIPHEIGLALGYPIKDVLGYMGFASLQCTGACGWRVYGDPGPSLCRSREFAKAREQAAAFIGI